MRNTLCRMFVTHAIVRNIYSRTKCTDCCNFQVRNDMFSTTIYIDFWSDPENVTSCSHDLVDKIQISRFVVTYSPNGCDFRALREKLPLEM